MFTSSYIEIYHKIIDNYTHDHPPKRYEMTYIISCNQINTKVQNYLTYSITNIYFFDIDKARQNRTTNF